MKEKVDTIIIAGQIVTCGPGDSLKRGKAMKEAGVVAPGALAIKGSLIEAAGSPDEIDGAFECPGNMRLSMPECSVIPGLIDAHSHPVFAGSRVNEYMLRARGATYLEIHSMGGGIASTVKASREASDQELKARLLKNLTRMMLHGTTTAEAKSGYGLSAAEEIRQLTLLKAVRDEHPLELVPTFLGAHTVPEEHREDRERYIKEIIEIMMPEVSSRGLAEYADVFCEEGAFTVDESKAILQKARELGMGLRIHAEQFSSRGAAVMAAGLGAASCDHLLKLTRKDMELLKDLSTVAVFMPGSEFFLALKDYAPLREALDMGVPVALGTDFNAGSCLSESMPMAMSIAVLQMKMEPEEAINAATVNAAHSIGRGSLIGSLEKGRQADLVVLDVADYREWLYHFGVNCVDRVFKKGRLVYQKAPLR